jgi:uncharacterized protein (UPF0297 family)
MTEDNKRLVAMEESFKGMKEDITEIKSALIGNGLSGDKGMVGKVDKLEEQVSILTRDRIINSVYITWLLRGLGLIGTLVVAIIAALAKAHFEK